jgi:hypothetical protein
MFRSTFRTSCDHCLLRLVPLRSKPLDMGKDDKKAPNTIVRAARRFDDCTYDGELVNDLRHGMGSCRWANGGE